jgi:pimeloyl-ACP methyl ester carboxylesterase
MFMGKVIDPSVTDEGDSFSIDPSLDMYNPDNGWRPWPNPCTYDRDWLARYREAQLARIARIDEVAKASIAVSVGASARLKQVVPDDLYTYRDLRARAVSAKYMVIYRTLADPAYLDLSIDPDERAMGSLFAFPDPLDANYGRGGLARTMTARGWLSTWSALSSKARLADTMPDVKKPTLILHPTADTEIRVKEALEIRDAAGASDLTYVEMKGALHYLEGDRPAAMDIVADWIDARFN